MRKKTWKQIIALVLALILVCPTAYLNADANETAEQAPELYFDLEFENGVAKDATGNTTVTAIGNGAVAEKTFELNGSAYAVDAYNADKYVTGDHSYIEVQMNDVTTLEDMADWVTNGVTFEIYLWVNKVPTITTYFMGNYVDYGGLSLTTRKTAPGALNFQMSSNAPKTGRFPYGKKDVVAFPEIAAYDTTSADYALAQEYKTFTPGQLNHIVGSYDKETNMLSVYKNGELIGSGDYGTGIFETGRETTATGFLRPGVWGIGGNPGYLAGSLDAATSYSIIDARIYSGGITETQVKAAYEDCKNQVLAGEEVGIEMPEPYFDLSLENGVAMDAQDNTTVTSVGNGKVEKKTFELNGQSYTVDTYNAEQRTTGEDPSYLQVKMNDVTTLDQMTEWVMNGVTFEIYLWVEKMPTATTYYMGDLLEKGGITLTTRKKAAGELNLQMSSSAPSTARYQYDSAFVVAFPSLTKVKDTHQDYKVAQQYKTFDAGQLNHVVGSYDKETNMLSVYKNGELIGSGDYGTGTFGTGQESTGLLQPGVWGIGAAPSWLTATLDLTTAYSIVDARIYSGGVTAGQVQAAYEDCINQVLAGEEEEVDTETAELYFDLSLENGVATDAQDNTTVTSIGSGKVEKKIFEHDGKLYHVDAYNADSYVEGDHSYLELQMKDVTTLDQMAEWVMDGVTFEIYLWVEKVPTITTYYMGDLLKNGGITLTTRKKAAGELNFQMSSSAPSTARFPYDKEFVVAFPSLTKVGATHQDYELAQQYKTFDAGQLNHIVGTYDKKTNMLSVYKNGELIGSGDYGTGTFETGQESTGFLKPGVWGIGAAPSWLTATLDMATAYSVVDARIYSGAITEAQVQAAYEECTNNLTASGSIEMPEDIEVTQLDDLSVYESLTDSTFQELEGLPNYVYNTFGKYKGCVEGMGASMGVDDLKTHIFSETNNIAYLSWLKSLESEGWTQYSNNIIEGKNLFATYTKGEQSVYAYYIANKGETRIILQENVDLENKATDNQYESICEPLLIPVRLTHIVKNSGMGYVMRLSDGRFIVIDGGQDRLDDAKKIYNIMQKYNVLDNITIAAWIFTHAHEDHVWGPTAFLENYAEDCVIEEFIFNFPRRQDAVAFNQAYDTIYDPLFEAITTYWPNTKTVICHTGQEYYFADTKLEFLHTHEDFYPEKPSTTVNFNNSSSVFTIETGGQRILILADSYTASNNGLITMWGDYLKCDILQVSHHGLGGGVVELYELVDPETALMPTSRHYMTKPELDTGTKMAMAYAHTQWVVNNTSGNIKEVIAAGLEQRTLTLPYHPAEGVEYINWNQNGYVFQEPEKSEVTVPKAYMELNFANGILTNSGSGNVSFELNGGTIGKNTVYYKDEAYEVTSYRAEKGSENHILLTLEDVLSQSDLEDLYTSEGCTFETFVALDTPTESNVGLLASCNGGGAGLFMRTVAGTFMFQLANTSETGDYYNSNYSYASITNERDVANVPAGKKVAHLVGTYDPETNMLRMYHNGVLVSEQNYGDKGFFKAPADTNAPINVLGIGINAAMPSEILTSQTGYTILESRIYDSCLSEEQVAASYWRDIEALGEEPEVETNVTEDENGAGITFLGGSLRMDYENYDKTSLRFGYKITLPEGATLNSWGWSYTTVDPNNVLRAEGVNKVVNSDGTIDANLVITGIPRNYYDLVITAKMKIEYTLDGNVYTLEETVVRERSVNIVANLILGSMEATQKEKDYANCILQ